MKSVDEIRSGLLTEYSRLQPDLDLSEGTPERDIFIEAQIAGALSELWDNEDYTSKLFAPLKYYADLNDADIENYCSNYDITRRPATKSAGIVTFYSFVRPQKDISIPSGTSVSTKSTPKLSFITTTDFVASTNNIMAYYNALNSRWEYNLPVEAVTGSSLYRAGAGTVTTIDVPIAGVAGCENTSSISGGSDAETNESMLQRVVARFQSRGLNNDVGIKSYAENYSSSAYVASAGDPLMQRDNGLGGAVDIYVKGSTLTDAQDKFILSSTGFTDITSGYTTTSITLTKQPVQRISSILLNNNGVPQTYFTLSKDVGLLQKSTRSKDKLVLTSTGITELGSFKDGDTIEVNYTYNSLLSKIEENLNVSTNKYFQRDYLGREMTEAPIRVELRLTPISGGTIDSYKSSWDVAVSNYLNTLRSGATVYRANILDVYNGLSTVDNIDITSIVITDVNGIGTVIDNNIVLPSNAYAVFGSSVYTLWTV